jgi:hypothetical protein
MIQTSEQIDAISAALVKAQAKIQNVGKTGTAKATNSFSYKYAELPEVLDEARGKLSAEGIYILQATVNGEGSNIGVITRLLHSSGQWIESALYVAPTKFDAQGVGSVSTYLRRYALMSMVGIGADDDDGTAATVAAPQPQRAGMVRAADVPLNGNGQQAERRQPIPAGDARTATERCCRLARRASRDAVKARRHQNSEGHPDRAERSRLRCPDG